MTHNFPDDFLGVGQDTFFKAMLARVDAGPASKLGL